MTQRLLVTAEKYVKPKDHYSFDCIYTEEGTLEDLIFDWGGYNVDTGESIGPWKLNIRGHEIIDQFMEDFLEIKKYIPFLKTLKDCWTVHDNDKLVWNYRKGAENMPWFMESFFEFFKEEESQE